MSKQESTGENNPSFRDLVVKKMIERKHKKVLPSHYWNLPQYKTDYQYQLRVFSKLIKIYSKEAILKTIDKETWCWSLNNPKIQAKIDEEQQKIDREKSQKEAQLNNKCGPNVESPNLTIQSSPSFRRKKKENLTDG